MRKFTRSERNAMIEKSKTWIIVLLCLCCLYFSMAVLDLYKGQISMGTFWGGNKNAVSLPQGTDNSTQNVVNKFWQLSRPETILAVSGGERRIVKKSDPDYQQIFEKINVTMRDIYSVRVDGILASNEEQWRNCLTEDSVYVKFITPRDTAFESLFYGVSDSGLRGAIEACGEIVFVPDRDLKSAMTVYIKDTENGKIVRVAMQTDTEIFKNAINASIGRGREFSFGFEADTDGLASQFIVPAGEVETNNILIRVPRVYKTGISFTKATEVTTGLINLFGYNPNTVRQYEDTDGALIYVGETGSLRLHPNGRIEYKALSESEGVPIATAGSSSASAYSMVAGLSDMIDKIYTIGGVMDEKHNAELKITDFGQGGMTFDYFVDGIKVSIGDETAVSAIVKNGVLTEFRMCIKTIEKTENLTLNPSALTAVQEYRKNNPGVKTVSDGELIYIYNGDDNETSAVWDIRGEF